MAAFVAEFIGTFALIFIGAGSIIASPTAPGVMGTLVGIALAHGLTIAVMGSATGHVSGGHLNPAVTIGMLTTGRIDATKAAGYIVSQVLGAIVAALLLTITMPAEAVTAAKLGTPLLAPNVGIGAGIILEAITTFFLMFVIFGTAVDKRGPSMGALFIGFTVALDILAIGPLTGAAMNPARSIGPALLGGHMDNFWVYWVGPIIGAVVAALVYHNVLLKKD
jgi:aquaporin Z